MHRDLFTQEFDLSATSPAQLWDLAREYHDRCEAFDRTVCTGGADAAGIVHPANHRELWAINRNAHAVLTDVTIKARAAGFTRADLLQVIRKVT